MRFVATTNVCVISAIHGGLVKSKIGTIKKNMFRNRGKHGRICSPQRIVGCISVGVLVLFCK